MFFWRSWNPIRRDAVGLAGRMGLICRMQMRCCWQLWNWSQSRIGKKGNFAFFLFFFNFRPFIFLKSSEPLTDLRADGRVGPTSVYLSSSFFFFFYSPSKKAPNGIYKLRAISCVQISNRFHPITRALTNVFTVSNWREFGGFFFFFSSSFYRQVDELDRRKKKAPPNQK